MADDIVTRLLALHHPDASDGADEIEWLRDLVGDLRRCLVDDQLQIERLRIALALACGELSTHGSHRHETPEMLSDQFIEEARRD